MVPSHNDANIKLLDQSSPATEWTSIYIVSACLFMGITHNSVYLSSLWPFIEDIDRNASASFYGVVMSAAGFGMLLGAPLFGIWVGKLGGRCRIPIVTGVALGTISSLLYCFVQAVPEHNRVWFLLIIRLFAGISGGSASACQSYTAIASTVGDRGKAMSFGATAVALGFLAGPALQALCATIGFPGYNLGGVMFLNMYTAPACVTVTLSLIVGGLVMFVLKESTTGLYVGAQSKAADVPNFDAVAAAVMIWCWFTSLFVFSSQNAISSPFAMVMFDWTTRQTTLYVGLMHVCSGILSIVGSIIFGICCYRKLNERMLVIAGMSMMGLFHLITFSWPFSGDALLPESDNQTETIGHDVNSTTLGCDPSRYTWCESTARVHIIQYLVPYFLTTVGFMTSNIVVMPMFSKILGPRNQGLFVACGSLGRVAGPTFMTFMFAKLGPRFPWGINICLTLFTALLVVSVRHRLVPLVVATPLSDVVEISPDKPMLKCERDEKA